MSKDIKVLSDAEHIRHRPEMYVGSVRESEEKVPILNRETHLIEQISLPISIGMYKIMDEVIDNAYDEAKRGVVKMHRITVQLSTKENKITVIDTGAGFKNAHVKRSDTGISNVETAVTVLRAGSNFDNTEDQSLIGMHGVGVSCTNVLSSEFEIETKEFGSTKSVKQKWISFKPIGALQISEKEKKDCGTRISFIPDKKIFGSSKYNSDVIFTKLSLKQLIINQDPALRGLNLAYYVDGVKQELITDIFPKETVKISSAIGFIAIMPTYDKSNSYSFINTAECNGVHNTIVKEQLCKIHKYEKAYKFLETFIILNLPPSLARFSGQNKDRLATPRGELESYLANFFGTRIETIYGKSELKKQIQEEIVASLKKKDLKDFDKKKKGVSKIKISDKYFPPSDTKNQKDIFIVEGLSALGSLLQKRDSKTQGAYALKGKPKNVKTIEDLKNNEFLELISILGLDVSTKKQTPKFNRIIIATDGDSDGSHIQALLINFFYRWFPDLIQQQKVFILNLPIIICKEGNKQRYFYEMHDFLKHDTHKYTEIKYAKGLGSYSVKDWEYIMKNMMLSKIVEDPYANNAIHLAFGKESSYRKLFLMNQIDIKDVPLYENE